MALTCRNGIGAATRLELVSLGDVSAHHEMERHAFRSEPYPLRTKR